MRAAPVPALALSKLSVRKADDMANSIMTRRSFTALAGVAALSALGLGGCSSGEGAKGGVAAGGSDANDGVTFSTHTEARELMGSADACDVRVGLIMGPPSMGLSQFIVAAQAGKTFNNFTFEPNGVDYVGLSALLIRATTTFARFPATSDPSCTTTPS